LPEVIGRFLEACGRPTQVLEKLKKVLERPTGVMESFLKAHKRTISEVLHLADYPK
jgi:hypothetical protein